MSKIAKGNYYQKKTKDWYEKEGYAVYPMEINRSIFIPKTKTVIYQKHDIAGADLLALREDDIIFIQCKTNKGDISSGIKEFHKYPYPDHIRRIVVRWEPRAKEPEIYDV